MPSFKDSANREWILQLDGPKIRDVRSALNIDLAALDGSAYEKMADDPVLLVDVLWVLCREQANSKQITDVGFGQSLVGDAIEHATAAMLQAIADFFPKSKRDLLLTLAKKNATTRELGMTKAMAALNDPELQTKMEVAMEMQMKEHLAKLLTPSPSAIDTPASSASAPTV